MTTLQLEQLVDRWEDRRDIKNLVGKYVHYLLLKKEGQIVDDLWANRDDICYGVNEGWYSGADAVRGYFGFIPGRTAKVAALLRAKFPEKLEGKSDEEIFGIGLMEIKSISNYIIEVAKDGQTAKAFACVFGYNTTCDEHGPVSNWIIGTMLLDLVLEEDEWKIWHMQYLEDIAKPAGNAWDKEEAYPYPELPEFAALKGMEPPAPNVPVVLRERYSSKRAFVKLPPTPRPYTTFAETFSYGM